MIKHNHWVAFKSIYIKEATRFLRIWLQTLVPPSITMTLYFVIFGTLIGERIGQMKGHSYMEFIVPGLIMMSVIQHSYANVSSSFFSAKFQRNIEELLVAPVPTHVIILGYITAGMTRGLLVGIIVTTVSMLFVDLEIRSYAVVTAIILLTSAVFSLAGLVNGVFAKNFDDISIIPTFVLTPLTYLGGVFYSIDLLPDFWQNVSKANPIIYMVDAFRYGFLGIFDMPVHISFAIIGVFVVILYITVYVLIHKGIGLKN